jgi:hypothetical protein
MDEVTVSFTIPRQDVEVVLALVGWLKLHNETPAKLGPITLDHPLLYDCPFLEALPALCDEVGAAALFYVRHHKDHGRKLYPAVVAFAAHEEENTTLADDNVRRFIKSREEAP